MAKVSIALRGWRFDEEAVFDEDGDFRPLEDVPEEERVRLERLVAIHDNPCHACWLLYGEEHADQCNVARAVYGEPHAELLLCDDHEDDFYYWYFEDGGDEYRGTETFADRFHEWFAAGNTAPEGYEGVEHVDTSPESLPDPWIPSQRELTLEQERVVDLREYGDDDVPPRADPPEAGDEEGGGDAPDPVELDLDGVDLDVDYR